MILDLTLRITAGGLVPNISMEEGQRLPGSRSQGQLQGHLIPSLHMLPMPAIFSAAWPASPGAVLGQLFVPSWVLQECVAVELLGSKQTAVATLLQGWQLGPALAAANAQSPAPSKHASQPATVAGVPSEGTSHGVPCTLTQNTRNSLIRVKVLRLAASESA